MSGCVVSYKKVNDLDLVQVNTGILSFEIMPALGGKISSLKDLRTGREWLWKNPRLAYKRVPHVNSYIAEADTGGWDECFPTVSACAYPSAPWTGAVLQDHGELWSQATDLEVIEEKNSVTLRSQWQGVALPYTFERSVTLEADSAHLFFEYTISNHADAPLHFIWSAHPLLAIEPEMCLLFPDSTRFNCSTATPENLIQADSTLNYPFSFNVDSNKIDLRSLPDVSVAFALKLWSDPLAEGWATLRAEDGEFRMFWDVDQLPQVALWMNIGAWAGDGGAPYYNLGLEPCIGAQDSLEDAVKDDELFATLSPQGTRTWQLEILLTPTREFSQK